jgi:hypothetical protein
MRRTITVTGLEAANFMIDQGCEMIGLEGIPETLETSKMIFRSENVYSAYGEALSREFSALTDSEYDRILSMVALLTCVEKAKLEEQVRGETRSLENDNNSTSRVGGFL